MKKIGFLSFGHWTPSPHSQVRTASDALLQSIELSVAAEELGADGAYFRVHHFARGAESLDQLVARDVEAQVSDKDLVRNGRLSRINFPTALCRRRAATRYKPRGAAAGAVGL